MSIEINIFDQVEEREPCRVQILLNTVTGVSSVGWEELQTEDVVELAGLEIPDCCAGCPLQEGRLCTPDFSLPFRLPDGPYRPASCPLKKRKALK